MNTAALANSCHSVAVATNALRVEAHLRAQASSSLIGSMACMGDTAITVRNDLDVGTVHRCELIGAVLWLLLAALTSSVVVLYRYVLLLVVELGHRLLCRVRSFPAEYVLLGLGIGLGVVGREALGALAFCSTALTNLLLIWEWVLRGALVVDASRQASSHLLRRHVDG